jgi:RNA recognition motif-containing protein
MSTASVSQTIFITFHRFWSILDLKRQIKELTGIEEFEKIKTLNTPAVYMTCKSISDCEKIITTFNGLVVDGYPMKVRFADDEVRRPQMTPGVNINPLTNVKLINLSEKTTKEDLQNLFQGLGCAEIQSMTIFDVEEKGTKQTMAFVNFSESSDLKKITERPLYLHGNKLFVKRSPSRNSMIAKKLEDEKSTKVFENAVVYNEVSFPKLVTRDSQVAKIDFSPNIYSENREEEDEEQCFEGGGEGEEPQEFSTVESKPKALQEDQEKYIEDLEFRVGNLECTVGNLECTIDYLYRCIEVMNHPGNPNLSKSVFDYSGGQYSTTSVSTK